MNYVEAGILGIRLGLIISGIMSLWFIYYLYMNYKLLIMEVKEGVKK